MLFCTARLVSSVKLLSPDLHMPLGALENNISMPSMFVTFLCSGEVVLMALVLSPFDDNEEISALHAMNKPFQLLQR